MNRRVIVSLLVLLGILGGIAWKAGVFAPRPSYPLAPSPGDTIVSWNFQGAYTGHPDLKEKAKSEIKRLSGLLGKKEETGYPDYILYVGIANEYDLLGDGAKELEYLRYALALDATTTGLAWHNAGQLFARLGALRSARHALEQAVLAQPIIQYHQALLDLLADSFPEDVKSIAEERRALGQISGELAQ